MSLNQLHSSKTIIRKKKHFLDTNIQTFYTITSILYTVQEQVDKIIIRKVSVFMQTGSGKVTGEGQRSRWRLGWERIGRSHTRLCIYTTTTDAQCTSGTDQWNTVTVFPQFMQKLFFPFGFFQLHKQLICSMIISFFHTLQIKMGAQYIFHFVQIEFFLSLYKLI